MSTRSLQPSLLSGDRSARAWCLGSHRIFADSGHQRSLLVRLRRRASFGACVQVLIPARARRRAGQGGRAGTVGCRQEVPCSCGSGGAARRLEPGIRQTTGRYCAGHHESLR